MIEAAPSDLASWTRDGTSFVIKNPTEFSNQMLPKYFKHNTFTSFVRQLNFYGFKKIHRELNDSLASCSSSTSIDIDISSKHWWEFQHPHFVRNQKDSMKYIKRKTYSSDVSTENISELKDQVTRLTSDVTELVETVEHLARQLKPPAMSDLLLEEYKVEDSFF